MRASPGPRHRSATAPVPGAPLSIPLKHSRGPPVYKRPARQTEKGAKKKKKKKKKKTDSLALIPLCKMSNLVTLTEDKQAAAPAPEELRGSVVAFAASNLAQG